MVKTFKRSSEKHSKKLLLVGLMFCMSLFMVSFTSAITWDPIAYYSLDETSGVVIDSANGYNGTNDGADTGVTGKVNTAYDFVVGNTDYISIDDVPDIASTDNKSFQFWLNVGDIAPTTYIMDTTGRFLFLLSGGGTADEYGFYDGIGYVYFGDSTVDENSGDWVHLVLVVSNSGTNTTLYRNGVQYGSSGAVTANAFSGDKNLGAKNNDIEYFYDGIMDEVGIWNRTLTQTEITELYNSGFGVGFEGEATIPSTITLESPLNESIISTTNVSFTFSGSNVSLKYENQWKNLTYYIWNTTGIFNTTFIDIVDNQTFNQTFNISDFVIGNYQWNVYGCYSNATSSNCTFAEYNNTFEWRPFEIVSQGYGSYVYETDYKNFNLTINTLPEVLSVSSKLNYNGTLYGGTTSCSGGVCNIYSNIDIPLVATGETMNNTVYWNITVYDGTSSYSFTTEDESFQQNVTRIHLEECGGAYTLKAINFTAYYETNLTQINPFYIVGTFDNWLGSGSVYRTSSFNKASTSNLSLCITPAIRNQYSNAQIEYKFENENVTFIPRNYFFQNKILTNITEEINLYLLEAEDSTSFIIKVQDQKLSPVTEALVYIQKYFPLDGEYRTVQIAKTDSNGETIGFYETETVDYKHIIIKNGETLLETAPQKVVGKSVPYTLTFTIGTSLGYPWTSFEENINVSTNLTFDEDTNIVTFDYIENETGYVSSGRLLVFRESLTNSTQLLICNVSSSESSASLTCDLGSYNGTFVAIGYINEGSQKIIQFIITDARDVFGNDGLFLGMMIILTAGFAMMWNPAAGIISINSAVIFVNIIGFITVSPIFIFGMISVSIITIILLKT